MAYPFQDPNQDEEEKKAAAVGQGGGSVNLQPPTTGEGGTLLGSDAPAAGANATGAGPGQTAAPTSSGWTNLRAYLDANQAQAGDIADKVSGNITSTGNAAKGAVDQGITDYNSKVAGSVMPGNAQDLASRASSNPAEFVKNPNDVQALKTFQSGVFSGPDKFEASPNYGDLATKAQSGTDLSKMAGEEGGQRTLLKNIEPNLTQGDYDLNQMLLSGVPGAAEKLKGAAQPFARLRSYLDTQGAAANSARDKAAGDFEAGKQTVKQNFTVPQTKSLADLQADLNTRTAGASTDVNKNQAIGDLQTYMAGNSSALSPDERALFEPEGLNFQGYDTTGLTARVRDLIREKLGDTWATPEYSGKGVDYLLHGTPIGGQQNAGSSSNGILDNPLTLPGLINQIGGGGGGGSAGGGQADPLEQYLDPLKSDLWKYSNDPLEKLRGQGSNSKPDWLSSFFPGTQKSSGTPTAMSVASPEEAARGLALQQLIDGSSSFLNPDEIGQAGTYRPANIGRYRPTISRNNGIPAYFGV